MVLDFQGALLKVHLTCLGGCEHDWSSSAVYSKASTQGRPRFELLSKYDHFYKY